MTNLHIYSLHDTRLEWCKVIYGIQFLTIYLGTTLSKFQAEFAWILEQPEAGFKNEVAFI